jgi:hypothetical protein
VRYPLLPAALNQFLKMGTSERSSILQERGILLDRDVEKGNPINLYLLDDFFAEEVLSAVTREALEVIPFRQGYRVELLHLLNRQ